jgi:hypothetical protein
MLVRPLADFDGGPVGKLARQPAPDIGETHARATVFRPFQVGSVCHGDVHARAGPRTLQSNPSALNQVRDAVRDRILHERMEQ